MKQLTQSEIRKNGKVYKNVSSPATEGAMKQVTDIVENNGVFSVSTDGGKTYSPAGGGGGGAASYKAIKSTLAPSDWQEVTKRPYFVGENAMKWAEDSTFDAAHAKRSETVIGLTVGVNYTISAIIDGQKYTKTAQIVDPAQTGGLKILPFYFDDDDTLSVEIYDDISAKVAGVGSAVVVNAPTTVTSFVITSFTGGGFGLSGKATISDNAIKINSAVTMYTNTTVKIAVGEKTNGSITLTADSVPTTSIPYSLEIVDTDTEGLFELVNEYIPPTIEIPTALPQKTSAIKTGTLPKGENYVQISDADITLTSDIEVIVSYKKELTGDLTAGMFGISLPGDEEAEKDIPFTYKIKQTDGKGQFIVVNSYIPSVSDAVLLKTITNTSTNVSITGSASPYLFTVADSDVTASKFVRLYPNDADTETWLNTHTVSSIITESSGSFTFNVDTATLPSAFSIKYIIESPQ